VAESHKSFLYKMVLSSFSIFIALHYIKKLGILYQQERKLTLTERLTRVPSVISNY